jgi:preprotein translocase subunit SecE
VLAGDLVVNATIVVVVVVVIVVVVVFGVDVRK